MSYVSHISLDELHPEYLNLLTPESKKLVDFIRPYYSKVSSKLHPIPTVLINWFKDTALNYQNILHEMKVTQYTVTKVEEKAMSNPNEKAYHEQFDNKYKDVWNNGTEVTVLTKGTTDFQTFGIGQSPFQKNFQQPIQLKPTPLQLPAILQHNMLQMPQSGQDFISGKKTYIGRQINIMGGRRTIKKNQIKIK